MRIRICRQEAKETAYWIQVLTETNTAIDQPHGYRLLQEAWELKKIFSAIVLKTEAKMQKAKQV